MDTGNWTMRALIRRCLAGEQKAWNQFFSICQPKIAIAARRRTLWYTNSPSNDSIDDIVADTFAKLCFDDYRVLRMVSDLPDHAVFGYLKRMAANLVSDCFRREFDSVNLEDVDLPADISTSRKMEMASQAKEQFHILGRELSGEPNGERDMHIFTLRYPYGYTVPEIARMFKMKLKDAENVIGRCQRILRDANKDEPRKGESGNGEPGKSERRKGKPKKDEPEKDEPGKVASG